MDYEPLFEPGFRDICLEDLYPLFVDSFDDSQQRRRLVDRFLLFLPELQEIGIKLVAWINGSFATKKPNPSDIDMGIVFDAQLVNSLPEDKKLKLSNIIHRQADIKIRYGIDIYFVPNNDKYVMSYWRGWFGFDKNDKPKGIPRLYIT